MLPLAVVEEIGRLLEGGHLSQRKIAIKMRVSRGTVHAIATGRRGLYGREPRPADFLLSCLDFPPERCCGCGAKVYKPCVLCHTRAYQRRQERLEGLQRLPGPRRENRVA